MRQRPGGGQEMFDLGWTELLVVGVVALIVVGPRDLPQMFRTLGQFTAKARGMAREFTRAMEDAADASGAKDVARDLRSATDPRKMGLDEVDRMRNWDPMRDADDADTPEVEPAATPARPRTDDATRARTRAEMDALAAERAAPGADEAPATPADTDPERGATDRDA